MRSLLLVFLLLAGCASQRGAVSGEPSLVGRIWDVRARRFIDQPALDAALRAGQFVLLGETHDNPEHHQLEARLVRAAAQGRRPALVFEMLTVDQQAPLDSARAQTPDEVARAVQWEKSGWPAFELYRPVFAAGLELGLPIVAGNLTRAEVRRIVMGGGPLPEDVSGLLSRQPAQSPAEVSAIREEMKEEHCGALPDSMLDPMALAQRARDARLAERMASAGTGGAILIAGAGHVRTDRAAPVTLRLLAPGATIVSVAMLEVRDGQGEPAAEGALPYDYVLFTRAAPREDPCAKLRARSKAKDAT